MAGEDAVIRTVPPGVVRAVALAVCGIGIVGMIVTSVADNAGAAVTFGLVAAAAALCLIVVAAVQPRPAATGRALEEAGAQLEARIEALVEAGADEATVRDLVREAVRLGRQSR